MNVAAENLYCIHCFGNLVVTDGTVLCTSCKKVYKKHENDTLVFLDTSVSEKWNDKASSDALVHKFKMCAKRYPKFFLALYYLSGMFVGKSAKSALRNMPENALILNIGSGAKKIRDSVINIDSYPFQGVHVVADVYQLPWKDQTVDAIVAESLCEHLLHPERAINEMYRVLKPGGLLYVVTPFMLGYHSSPNDYYRWTIPGLRVLFFLFQERESGVAWGPTASMRSIFGGWLATLLSFGSSVLYQLWSIFFTFLFGPLTVIDYLFKYFPFSQDLAHGFYYIGTKDKPFSP